MAVPVRGMPALQAPEVTKPLTGGLSKIFSLFSDPFVTLANCCNVRPGAPKENSDMAARPTLMSDVATQSHQSHGPIILVSIYSYNEGTDVSQADAILDKTFARLRRLGMFETDLITFSYEHMPDRRYKVVQVRCYSHH